MIELEEFVDAFQATQKNRVPNREQRACVSAVPGVPLMVVAGPRCGKTAALVLRALPHLLVDAIRSNDCGVIRWLEASEDRC